MWRGGDDDRYGVAFISTDLNPQTHMHAVCVDVDTRAVHMCYLQLIARHPRRGNSRKHFIDGRTCTLVYAFHIAGGEPKAHTR